MLRDDPAPPQIPDYQLLRKIGQGSYGVVWLAQGITGVYRAVKIVWRASFEDPQPYEREFRGIKEFAAVSLIEPRQLALLHVGRNDEAGFFYYVMELADDAVSGREIDPESYVPHTLREMRTKRGRLTAEETLALGVDLAGALAGLHAHELVHRDIKPSNIIFVGGVPKLADIGLVTSAAATALTMSRVGNPGYMPPDLPGTPSADVYGLGKVLYELATGRERDDYPRLPLDLDKLPDRKALLELNEIFVRACHANPEKRYKDAAAIREDLLLLQAGKSVRRLRAAERHLGRAVRTAAVLAIVAAIAGGGAWVAWRIAKEEMRRRGQAEAERDALARRSVYAGRMAQAHTAVSEGDFASARKLLSDVMPKAGEPDLRGAEWFILSRQAQGDYADQLRKGGPAITQLALSPDGAVLAVHDEEKNITIYDAVSRQQTHRISGVQRFAGFSSDGTWLVGTSTAPPSALQRWHVPDGAPNDAQRANGTYRPLAALGESQVVAVFDSASNKDAGPMCIVWDFKEHREVTRLQIAPVENSQGWKFFRSGTDRRGENVVVALVKGQGNDAKFLLALIDARRVQLVRQALVDFLPSAVGLLDSEGEPVAWAAEGNTGKQLVFRRETERWEPYEGQLPVGISSQWRFSEAPLVLQAHHAEISLAPIDQPRAPLRRFRGHATLVTSLLPDRRGGFFSAAANGELRWWDGRSDPTRAIRRQCWDSHSSTSSLVYSRDGKLLYAPLDGTNSAALDPASLATRAEIPGMRRPIGMVNEALWGIASDGRALIWWDEKRQAIVGETERGAHPIVQAAQARNGSVLCYTRSDGSLTVVNTSKPGSTQIKKGRFETWWSLNLDEKGTRLWAVDSARAHCLQLPDGVETWSIPLPVMASELCYEPRREIICLALQNGAIELRHANTGIPVREPIPAGGITTESLAATSDPFRLITVARDGGLRVIEPEFGTCVATLTDNEARPALTMDLAPDQSAAAVLSKSGILRVVQLH